MKTISNDMEDHLEQEVTTLTTLWEIKRRDGKRYFFTDLDRDITYEGNVYKADSGYVRTAITNDLTLNADNLELSGFFNDNYITRADVSAGLFDFAEVMFFMVNFREPSHGRIALRRGYLGEIQGYPSGRFNVELRGMLQSLSVKTGEIFSAGCRAQLGDSRCKFPIDPPIILRDKKYLRGEFLQKLSAAVTQIYPIPIANSDFQSSLTGSWTVEKGAPQALVDNTTTMVPSFRNSQALRTNALSASEGYSVSQTLSLTGVPGTDIDGGNAYMNFSVRAATGGDFQRDEARVRIVSVETGVTIYASKFATIKPLRTWGIIHANAVRLPSGTRTLKIYLDARTVSGASCEVLFDDVGMEVFVPIGAGITKCFSERIYECATGGVTDSAPVEYSLTFTTDGTAVFNTYIAYAKDTTVTTVANPRNDFTVSQAGAAGYYNGGTVTFETGLNKGLSMEIKEWLTGNRVKLFLDLPYDIVPGDILRLVPGCSKLTADCGAKFAINGSINFPAERGNIYNFRGEPFIPGDKINLYPNAKR